MSPEQLNHLQTDAAATVAALRSNPYPGRGIVLGQNAAGQLVQVYWIMGRSANSRNRVFHQEGDDVATRAADPSKLEDPSLIIYHPVRVRGRCHIVSNGDQTDTIMKSIEAMAASHGSSASSMVAFQTACATRCYEPDPPNFTPRISGLMDLGDAGCAYQLSILKANRQVDGLSQRNFFLYEKTLPGFGHCITTYRGDGTPLPTFAGEPQPVPLQDDIDAALDFWWGLLNEDNRISLLVKFIDPKTGDSRLRIVNKYQAAGGGRP
jgi:IMP cyclohydrolase